jgi:hypothetical protein
MMAGALRAFIRERAGQQTWRRHFRWEHTILVGKTKTGIVTVQVLNCSQYFGSREGSHPPCCGVL